MATAEQPNDEQVWSWPERYPTGAGSFGSLDRPSPALSASRGYSPQRPPSAEPPSSPPELDESQSTGPAGSSARELAIRSSIITLGTTLGTTVTTFGLKLTEAQSTALISAITAASALAALLIVGRRRG